MARSTTYHERIASLDLDLDHGTEGLEEILELGGAHTRAHVPTYNLTIGESLDIFTRVPVARNAQASRTSAC